MDERIRGIYAAFNARDVEALLEQMTPDVDWPNAWEGGRVHGREEVREYWRRQFEEIDPTVTPTRIETQPDGRVAVTVDQRISDKQGRLLGQNEVIHLYTFDQSGLVERMDVEEP
jgi:ketosteroid isomerase-like protein